MKRLLTVIILVSAVPSLSQAQEDDEVPPLGPGECTTTTTVRCTGAAARYGAPPALPLAPPPVLAPSGGVMLLDLNKLNGDGWKLMEHSDGTLWRERSRSSDSPGVWGSGLALFSISWLASGVASLTTTQQGPVGFLPVLGAWINAGIVGTSCDMASFDGSASCDHRAATALWAIDGLVQVAGFTMFLVGLASGPAKIERQPVLVAPGVVGTGAGLNALGRF